MAAPANVDQLRSQFEMLASQGAEFVPADLKQVFDGIFRTAEALLKRTAPPVERDPAALGSGRLREVHSFIEGNLHRPELSVADIARGTHTSRSSLYRLFDDQPQSVSGALREHRLQRGMRYLADTEHRRMSIGAIAHACGFSDQVVFSKQFRRRFGMTPREARAPQRA